MGDFDVYSSDLDGTIEIGDYKISNPKINIVTGDFFYSINFGYLFFKDHLPNSKNSKIICSIGDWVSEVFYKQKEKHYLNLPLNSQTILWNILTNFK